MNSEKTTLPGPSALLYPPGGLLIWSLVLMELFTFGVALTIFLINGREQPEVFKQGREHLNVVYGFTNTAFLLISGFFMATAVERFRKGENARPMILIAMVGGLLFLILKGVEYQGKFASGHVLGYDVFTTYYWLLTVFHVLHVVVGLLLLCVLQRRLRPASKKTLKAEDLEASAVFWHMCDLIWLIIFPIIYLLPS